MKLGKSCILCTNQENLHNNSIKIWLALFKDRNNFYEQWNSETSEPHRFKLDLKGKLDLKDPNRTWLYPIWVFIKLGKTSKKSEYNNNKFKISAPTWNGTFDLPDGSYSIADIQDYFEFIIKKHQTLTEYQPVQIYPNKIKSRTVFKIKTGYKLELLTPEIMKLLGSTKNTLPNIKTVKTCQNWNLLKLF